MNGRFSSVTKEKMSQTQIHYHKLPEHENQPLPPSREASQTPSLLVQPEDAFPNSLYFPHL